MSEEIEIAGVKVPRADWEATPASIRALVLVLSERLKQQDERLSQLEERLKQTSQISSSVNAVFIKYEFTQNTLDWFV